MYLVVCQLKGSVISCRWFPDSAHAARDVNLFKEAGLDCTIYKVLKNGFSELVTESALA
jgi:hypothetical protein